MEKRLCGDINGDNIVDLTDLTQLSLFLNGDVSLDKLQALAADINQDGEVLINDLASLKQYIMNNKIELPKEIKIPEE